jgi:hypothetical protein
MMTFQLFFYLLSDPKGRIYHLTVLITRFIHYFSVLRIRDMLVRIRIHTSD